MTSAQGPRRRVLVVDDNVDAAQTLATMLELDGHDSRSAFGGAEALRAVDDWLPDAMLVDLGMPGIDGYELCRRVRAQFGDHAPLMIASTGWGQPEDRRRSYEAGFDAHLVKPVEPERITALLAEHCGVTPESP